MNLIEVKEVNEAVVGHFLSKYEVNETLKKSVNILCVKLNVLVYDGKKLLVNEVNYLGDTFLLKSGVLFNDSAYNVIKGYGHIGGLGCALLTYALVKLKVNHAVLNNCIYGIYLYLLTVVTGGNGKSTGCSACYVAVFVNVNHKLGYVYKSAFNHNVPSGFLVDKLLNAESEVGNLKREAVNVLPGLKHCEVMSA